MGLVGFSEVFGILFEVAQDLALKTNRDLFGEGFAIDELFKALADRLKLTKDLRIEPLFFRCLGCGGNISLHLVEV